MGAAGSSLEDCDDKDEFHQLWMASSPDERRKLGVKIGRQMTELLKRNSRTPLDVKAELAKFVKSDILGKKP